jgi:hypothetical protein
MPPAPLFYVVMVNRTVSLKGIKKGSIANVPDGTPPGHTSETLAGTTPGSLPNASNAVALDYTSVAAVGTTPIEIVA